MNILITQFESLVTKAEWNMRTTVGCLDKRPDMADLWLPEYAPMERKSLTIYP